MQKPSAPAGRYTASVEASFSATHRLQLADGTHEPLHGHDWHVRVCFWARELNPNGMVIDFHDAQRALQAVLAPLHYSELNANPALEGQNPTAEAVAACIFKRLAAQGLSSIGSVTVSEAPGCWATFERWPGC